MQALLKEFLETLGVDDVAEGVTSFSLDFENGSSLSLERTPAEDLLLVLLRPLMPYQGADAMRAALRMCHFHESLPFLVQPALRGEGDLLFALYLPRDQALLSSLRRAVDLVREMDVVLVGALR